MAELEHFVDQLLAEKGVQSADPEVRAQIREDLINRVDDRVQALIMANLPEDELDEFSAKLDTGSDEDIQAYLRKTIPGFDEKVAVELVAFKAAYTS